MSDTYEDGFDDGFSEAVHGFGYGFELNAEQWQAEQEKTARAIRDQAAAESQIDLDMLQYLKVESYSKHAEAAMTALGFRRA